MKEFKTIFSELRKEKGYSQTDIASVLGVSKSTVAMWETGKRIPQRITMEQIADVFNVDMDYLCRKTDIRKKISFDNTGNAYVNVPEYDPDIIEIIDIMSKISKEQKQTILAMLRSFIGQ